MAVLPPLPTPPVPLDLGGASLNVCEFTVVVGHAAHYELPLAVPVGRVRERGQAETPWEEAQRGAAGTTLGEVRVSRDT